ncbi:shikimate kinase [Myroides sp. LJL116]
MKKIILLGYMGSGKSTIGQKLAQQLHLPFIDLDQQIEKQLGKSVSDIFKEHGEIYFRKKEHEILHSLLEQKTPFVLSLGGGTPCYANNHLALKLDQVTSIYLKGSIATLASRLEKAKEHRPLLNQKMDDTLETYIAKHLFDRSYFYYKAKHVLSIDDKSIDQVVEQAAELALLT